MLSNEARYTLVTIIREASADFRIGDQCGTARPIP